jgi:general secretion pathway protein H
MQAPVANRGFTLLEMLVVLVLMSIAIGLVGFGLQKGMQSANERKVVAQMVQALRATRAASIVSGRTEETRFDLRGRTFKAPGQPVQRWPEDLGVELNTASQLDSAFAFNPDGSSSGGNLVLFHGERNWRIDIGWLTGSVKSKVLR